MESSQVITGVILKAFGACAASQSTCNNLTFGSGGKDANGQHVAGWGYVNIFTGPLSVLSGRIDLGCFFKYETIAGGSGAGPTWNGTSGVHSHMTNTRITVSEPTFMNDYHS